MSREQGQAPRKAVRPPLSARCLVVWRFARSKARSADAGTRRDRSNVAIHQHNPKIHLREMSCAVTPCTRSEEHTSELQSLMRNSYAVFCLKKKNNLNISRPHQNNNKKQ